MLHRKYDKNEPEIYDLMTECIECIEYIYIEREKEREYMGYIADILDILYIQEAYLL